MMEIESSKPAGNGIAVGGLSPLSESLWKEKTDTEFIGDVSARLTWKDLTVTVSLGSGETQKVLEGLTGYAEPGSLTALMGPSGSGKSTLLDALSSRLATNAFLSGTILLNGRKAKLSFGAAAYVTQDDNLIGTLTVRETISYSARLRLPNKMPWSEKQALVESTIIEMGLQDCADTVIGNWHLRGISGGEKRRVSIALEILMRPRMLFLDEPTSGLDSASAFFVTQTLRGLSRDGRTVIASIHQPSSEVFELFDCLYLLSGGRTVYFGKASEAYEFFAHAGFPCPAMRNPSDHFLRCINSDFDKVKATLKGSMKLRFLMGEDPLEKTTTAEATRMLISFYSSSQYYYTAKERVEEISEVKGTVLESGGSQASFLMQTFTLTKRSFVNMSRDFGYYWLRLLIYIVETICIGTIYFNVGTSYNSILARGSCASFVFGFVTFMSIGGFPSFVEDMKVFHAAAQKGTTLSSPASIEITISALDSKITENKIPTPTQFNHLVNDLSNSIRAGAFVRLEDAVGLFNRMVRTQPLPSIQTFNRLLTTIAKMKHYSTAISLHREMNWLGIPSDICTWNILLNCSCRLNGIGSGFAVLSNILKRGHEPNVVTLNTFIKGFCMEGRIGEASSFFLKTVEMGYPYNVVSFGILIDGLCKSGNNAMALGLLRKMEKGAGKCSPDLTVYNTIIDSLSKDGLTREALNLFSEMISKRILPDVFTYSSLIHGLCNLGQWKEAMSLFEEMSNRGISPDVTTFNILVNALCEEGMVKESHRLLESMTQRGVEPDVITYSALMNGYCCIGQMDAALKIFDYMVCKGHKPSVVTYAMLISGYCKKQMVDKAMWLFREMSCKGLKPDVVTYNTLIGGLYRVRRIVAAQELFNEMQAHGQCPNLSTYAILMDGLCKSERPVEAMKLLNEMQIRGIQPNNNVIGVLINGMCEARELKYAKELFSWASTKGLGNNVRTYNTLINGLCKEGLLEEANGLFFQMEEKGFQPDSVTFNALIRGFLQKNETLKAMQLLGEVAKRHFSVDASTATMLVGLLTEDEKGQEYLGMLHKFVPYGEGNPWFRK